MPTSSYLLIRGTTVTLLEEQGFTKQEALHLIDAETGYLTYKDRTIINKLSFKRKEVDINKIVITYQKQKLIEYLLGLNSRDGTYYDEHFY